MLVLPEEANHMLSTDCPGPGRQQSWLARILDHALDSQISTKKAVLFGCGLDINGASSSELSVYLMPAAAARCGGATTDREAG